MAIDMQTPEQAEARKTTRHSRQTRTATERPRGASAGDTVDARQPEQIKQTVSRQAREAAQVSSSGCSSGPRRSGQRH